MQNLVKAAVPSAGARVQEADSKVREAYQKVEVAKISVETAELNVDRHKQLSVKGWSRNVVGSQHPTGHRV